MGVPRGNKNVVKIARIYTCAGTSKFNRGASCNTSIQTFICPMCTAIVQLMLHCSLLWTFCLRFLTKSPAIPQQLYKTASSGLSAIADSLSFVFPSHCNSSKWALVSRPRGLPVMSVFAPVDWFVQKNRCSSTADGSPHYKHQSDELDSRELLVW